jgi:hypothetical protein
MKIKRAPSGRNAYWFQTLGEHQILHLGCFAVPLERSLDVYGELLDRLYQANPSAWVEFQSYKTWWFNERRRDYRLQWKAPAYEDRAHLAYVLTGQAEIVTALKTFWLLKELRFYFWKQDSIPLQPQDIVAAVARNEFEHLTRYIPSVIRFAVARQICSSYLRVMFHRSDAKLVDQLLAESAAKSGLEFLLEASMFKTGGD